MRSVDFDRTPTNTPLDPRLLDALTKARQRTKPTADFETPT